MLDVEAEDETFMLSGCSAEEAVNTNSRWLAAKWKWIGSEKVYSAGPHAATVVKFAKTRETTRTLHCSACFCLLPEYTIRWTRHMRSVSRMLSSHYTKRARKL